VRKPFNPLKTCLLLRVDSDPQRFAFYENFRSGSVEKDAFTGNVRTVAIGSGGRAPKD
jgi:hypothetical protein